MDFALQQALQACGSCGRPERDHQFPAAEGMTEVADVLFALGGGGSNGAACTHFTISDAALRYQRHLNIANGRAGRGNPQRCGRCALRGHATANCPL